MTAIQSHFGCDAEGWTYAAVMDGESIVMRARAKALKDAGMWLLEVGKTGIIAPIKGGEEAKKHLLALIRERLFEIAMSI